MDWNTLPDLLALTGLVAVFFSLLPRKTDSSLRLWVAAWILIVIHFAAKFADASGTNVFWSFVTLGTLDLAGLCFMWAAVSHHITRHGCVTFAAFAVPQLGYIALGILSVHSIPAYVAAVFAGFVLPIAVTVRAPHASARDRILSIISNAVLACSLLLVIALDSDPSDGINNILTWLFLSAGILHWRRYPRATAGVITTVAGFIVWGLVFPAGVALDTWAPHLHIDDTAYNIPKYIVAIGIILTLLEEQREHSVFLSLHDDLTGLPNRRMLEERLGTALERAKRTGGKAALFAIDLDGFKNVNDSFGHHAGDGFLRDVAQRFARRIRKVDTCARFGGDEFIVLADGIASRADAETMARALLGTLADPIDVLGQRVYAAASIGIAVYPDDGRDPETLHAVADASMYAAKHARRRRTYRKAVKRAAV
jgi:diguanylate cyclase (GGDEF)-like protein